MYQSVKRVEPIKIEILEVVTLTDLFTQFSTYQNSIQNPLEYFF